TRRAGVAIHPLAANLEAAPLRPESVDAVLVDAPCSATGTIRRHPDARWRLHPALFARSAQRQDRLLDAAAALVRPGGLLIYATCSLEPEENEQVVERFLKQHPELARTRRDWSERPDARAPAFRVLRGLQDRSPRLGLARDRDGGRPGRLSHRLPRALPRPASPRASGGAARARPVDRRSAGGNPEIETPGRRWRRRAASAPRRVS